MEVVGSNSDIVQAQMLEEQKGGFSVVPIEKVPLVAKADAG